MIYYQKSSEREVSVTLLPDNKVKKSVYCFLPYVSAEKFLNTKITAFSKFLNFLKEEPQNSLVKIYDYQINLNDNFYCYVMEHLKSLNKKEESLADDFYNYHNGNLSKKEEREYSSLIKSHYKLYQFLEENCSSYNDVHGGNIGINKNSEYKFMDLEGAAWDFDAKQDCMFVKFKNKIIFKG